MTPGGWHGKGVSASDVGSLLCTQHAAGGDTEEHKHFHSNNNVKDVTAPLHSLL